MIVKTTQSSILSFSVFCPRYIFPNQTEFDLDILEPGITVSCLNFELEIFNSEFREHNDKIITYLINLYDTNELELVAGTPLVDIATSLYGRLTTNDSPLGVISDMNVILFTDVKIKTKVMFQLEKYVYDNI